MSLLTKQSIIVLLLASAPALAEADALSDANSLLRLTNTEAKFAANRDVQTRDIIRTYTLIVREMTNQPLPHRTKTIIAQCYRENYDFARFKAGIASIIADTFSPDELKLLVDFHSNLSLPPSEIGAFKDIIGKSERLQVAATEFIYNNSEGCLEQGSKLVVDFINAQQQIAD